MIVVTAATGHLGTLVLEHLLARVPAERIRAAVRTPSKAAAFAARGVEVVQADYDDRASLERAFEGAERLLLISSSEVGRRLEQHGNAVEAAKAAGVEHIVYTSLLKADTSHSVLADEHVPTEALIRRSGIDHTFLRNGWYIENYTENLAQPLAGGAFYGAAQDGRIAAAARTDFAEAAAVVLTTDGHAGRTYELAGPAFTMAELAATVSAAAGKEVGYVDLPEEAYRQALVDAGLPEGFAHVLANADAAIARGDLEAPTDDLVGLIGHAPKPLAEVVRSAVA